MSDLEFQRELTPDELAAALSLLDRTVGSQTRQLNCGEEAEPKPDQADAGVAEQDRAALDQHAQQRLRHLKQASLRFCGLGIAAAAALMVLSWSEKVPTRSPQLGIVHEQLANVPRAPDASAALPAANSAPSESPVGSNQQSSMATVVAPGPGDSAPAIVKDAANPSDSASAFASDAAAPAQSATISKTKVSRHEGAEQKSKEAFRRRRTLRAAKIESRECFLFACFAWEGRHMSYEPPRNMTQ